MFNDTEKYKFSHNIVKFDFHSPGGRPLKCLHIAHKNFQSPRVSGQPLNSNPGDPVGVTELLARWTEILAGGPKAGRSGSTPLARVMGVWRQQQPYGRGIFQSRSHDCLVNSHECLVLFTSSCYSECFFICRGLCAVYECQRVECAFTSLMRTECGMFVMYCMQ